MVASLPLLALASMTSMAPSPPPPPGDRVLQSAHERRWLAQQACTNTCTYAKNAACSDGGFGSQYDSCDLGTDCYDCSPRNVPPSPLPPLPPPPPLPSPPPPLPRPRIPSYWHDDSDGTWGRYFGLVLGVTVAFAFALVAWKIYLRRRSYNATAAAARARNFPGFTVRRRGGSAQGAGAPHPSQPSTTYHSTTYSAYSRSSVPQAYLVRPSAAYSSQQPASHVTVVNAEMVPVATFTAVAPAAPPTAYVSYGAAATPSHAHYAQPPVGLPVQAAAMPGGAAPVVVQGTIVS